MVIAVAKKAAVIAIAKKAVVIAISKENYKKASVSSCERLSYFYPFAFIVLSFYRRFLLRNALSCTYEC